MKIKVAFFRLENNLNFDRSDSLSLAEMVTLKKVNALPPVKIPVNLISDHDLAPWPDADDIDVFWVTGPS